MTKTKRVSLNARILPPLDRRLEAVAQREARTKQAVIELALTSYCAESERQRDMLKAAVTP